jgi:hypothetical protein
MTVYRIALSIIIVSAVGHVHFALGAADNSVQRPVLRQTKISNPSVDVNYVRVSLKDFDVRVLAASAPTDAQPGSSLSPDRMASGYSLQDYQSRYGAFAVLSGGFIDSYSPPTPLGLVRSNGVQISGIHHSWLVDGFFCSDTEHAEIVPVSNDVSRENFRDCVQSGPLLLLDKKEFSDPARDEIANFKEFAGAPYERTFVCITNDGNVILGLTGKVELPKLASALLEPEFNCRDAIGLTSFVSAGLRVGDTLLGGDNFLFPSVIAITPRAPGLAPRAPINGR